MSQLNAKAAELMQKFPVNACTDITGFGLLGHLKEMTTASGVDAQIFYNQIPVIEGVKDLALADIIPGGTKNNLDFVKDYVHYDSNLSEIDQLIMNDAQTSGGLLISLPEKFKDDFIREYNLKGMETAVVIGKILVKGRGEINVVP